MDMEAYEGMEITIIAKWYSEAEEAEKAIGITKDGYIVEGLFIDNGFVFGIHKPTYLGITINR